ncbi:cell envelope integrity EipB family protein [Pseudovibrio sp. Tun.PSC04-5.I4]|uniref:cell envelope integrity EipB family protein n=1 Tax=Pseudovibrio sp. Tun.PSC04-5.I4 TaxID=1798213 RepID=UPI00088561C5|nr:cell envelope integrity EipB family protein [Pseudovibrio sp. Tun.PSC04-5.I4]SDR39344.1 protein of unknown function [Pseudovibrio sp. Tun.PSC04-5.I4]
MRFSCHRRFLTGVAGISLSLGWLGLPNNVLSAELQPHRAIYDMRLSSAESGSKISDVTGRMVYELSGSACAGFTVDLRFVVMTTDGDGAESVTDIRTTYYEAPDNGKLTFAYQTFIDDYLAEEARGTATNQPTKVDVDLVGPDVKQLSFDGSIMFPLQHLHSMIDAAASGQHFMATKLYDGSATGDTLYDSSVVIGRQLPDPLAQRSDHALMPKGLARADAWPVSIAYFDLNNKVRGERSPDYQLRAVLHENGVSRSMHLNYGLFQLDGALVELDLKPIVPMSACNTSASLEEEVSVPLGDVIAVEPIR